MTTKKQKAAVRYCEHWLDVHFTGDLDDFDQVSSFLGAYLDYAKIQAMELSCEYEADRGY